MSTVLASEQAITTLVVCMLWMEASQRNDEILPKSKKVELIASFVRVVPATKIDHDLVAASTIEPISAFSLRYSRTLLCKFMLAIQN